MSKFTRRGRFLAQLTSVDMHMVSFLKREEDITDLLLMFSASTVADLLLREPASSLR